MGMRCGAVFAALLASTATLASAANDALDPHFGAGGVALFGATPVSARRLMRPRGLAVQTDGKLLLAGATDGLTVDPNPVSTLVPAVARLNADGSWDESFGDHGIYAFPGSAAVSTYGGEGNQVVVVSDGSIVAAGETYTQLPGNEVHSCTLLFKLGAGGTLDTTFGTDGSLCFDFAPEPPGTTYFDHFESIAAGAGDQLYLTTADTNLSTGAVARFMPDGTLDGSYGTGGIATSSDDALFTVLSLLPDERVVATGGAVTYRFTDAGVPDPTFGIGGESVIDFGSYTPTYAAWSALDGAGRLISGLYSFAGPPSSFMVSRIGADGTLDAAFNGAQQQPGFPGFAAVPLQAGSLVLAAMPTAGGIFAVGVLDLMGNTIGLVRLDVDASFDESFGDPTQRGWTALRIGTDADSYNVPYGAAKDGAGRVYVSAVFTGSNLGGNCDGIIRFVPDDLFNDGLDPLPVRTCPP